MDLLFRQLGLTLILGAVPLPAATLYQHATLLTLAVGSDTAIPDGFMLVSDGGTIAALGPGDGEASPAVMAAQKAPGLVTVNLHGRIVMPGFVSGHSHLWQSAFRGLTPGSELPAWLDALHYTYGGFFGPGDFGAFTQHGAYDQLRHGVTTTYNHSHFLGRSFENYAEQFTTELTVPQRFIFSWVNDPAADDATWRARLRPILAQVDPRADRPLLGVAINAMGIFRGPGHFAREIALAKELKLSVQVHYLEAAASQESDRAAWAVFKEAGAVYPGISFAHFIHADDTIVREAAAAGAAMIWNPLSNGRLGSGLAPIERYLAAGLHVGMGEDGQASADISDPFENVRFGLYALRIRRENAGGLQPIDVLRLHTLKTAEVFGVQRWIGSLEPGKFADFLVVDPGEPGTGAIWDVPATIVFACSSRNVAAVYVGGRKVVEAGHVIGLDAAQLESEVVSRVAAIRARAAAAKASGAPPASH
jgi:cytosine/adenosine deaminase-related metal-dependent hydrolase